MDAAFEIRRAHLRYPPPRRSSFPTACLAFLIVSLGYAADLLAQEVVARVQVDHGSWSNCGDGPFGGPPEIYWIVTIDGQPSDNRSSAIYSNISPFNLNLEFSQRVDFTKGSVSLRIEQRDRDGGLTFDDDRCDISPVDDILDLTLDLVGCSVSGDVSGTCGTSISASGAFRFTVFVDEPPSAPGLQVTCIHDPIWPQPGQTVTITANSLDGVLAPRLADAVEIRVDNRTAPALTMAGTTATFTSAALPGPTFNYGCRIKDDGLIAWTGWRTVAVGTSDLTAGYGDRIPVLYTGTRSSRLDMVFYADRDSYAMGSSDPAFLGHVRDALTKAYFTEDIYLDNQDKMNYWIALPGGKADPDCEIDAPQKSWEDTGIVLHTDDFRDCAPGGERVFSTEPGSFRTILHESGHLPFGMADEYCCDGGYFQAAPFPNVYHLRDANMNVPLGCADDAPSVGKTAADCRSWVEPIDWWFDNTWWTSDPVSDDLMVDRQTRRELDTRRMGWLFDVCRGAGC